MKLITIILMCLCIFATAQNITSYNDSYSIGSAGEHLINAAKLKHSSTIYCGISVASGAAATILFTNNNMGPAAALVVISAMSGTACIVNHVRSINHIKHAGIKLNNTRIMISNNGIGLVLTLN